MSNGAKATTNTAIRNKAIIVIGTFAVLALFSIIMSIYDISTDRVVFGILFAVAALIFIIMLLLKINAVFGTYIETEDNLLLMKSWVNDFLPYETGGGVLSDLVPSKTKLVEIPVEDISLILVGTKDFIKRNISAAGKRLVKALYPYEHTSNKTKKSLISQMDLFYIETTDGECSFMCIDGFDAKKVVDVIGEVYIANPEIYVKVGSSDYRKYIKRLLSRLEK